MTPSKLARQNAIPLELKKDGLFQRQSGDWVLRFVVQASEMNEQLMRAAMGTRFQAALVEIGIDELPVRTKSDDIKLALDAAHYANEVEARSQLKYSEIDNQPVKEQPAPEPHSGRVGWDKLQPASQCAIRLNDPIFLAFLKERYDMVGEHDLKQWFEISSKTELSTNHKKRVLWHQLDQQFQAWKMT